MNNRTSFVLLAVLTAVGTLTMSTTYAEDSEGGEYMEDRDIPQECVVGCSIEDARIAANQMLLDDLPISVWTDKTDYNHSDMIKVSGQVANRSGIPVALTVVSPLNSLVTIGQLDVANDGSFETTLNTAGSLWKYDGTYIIKVSYGSAEKSNNVKVELTGGVLFVPNYDTPDICGVDELTASGQCIPYSISGGTVTSAAINIRDKSIVINIDAEDDGMLIIDPAMTVATGPFFVLVDREEPDDVEIDVNHIAVMFPAGTEQIEIIATWVIPEFGVIAAMILAVAIITVIAVSAKSRLSIIPRY